MSRTGTPLERREAALRDQVDAERRQLQARPGTPAFLCATDDLARCQRELHQLDFIPTESQLAKRR